MKEEISRYRLDAADRHFSELRGIMDPESVQIADAVIAYLCSGEFFALVVIFLVYRLVRSKV